MQKGKKRVHRLVVLPDYQGIGIGTAFITAIGKIIEARGYELNLTTTTPAIVNALVKRDDWILARYGRVKNNLDYFVKRYGLENEKIDRCSSAKRVTYSFWYKGGQDGSEKNRGGETAEEGAGSAE